MGLNELDSRHKKTTKVLNLSGFDGVSTALPEGTPLPVRVRLLFNG